MYPNVNLWEALLFLVGGIWVVSWSAERFVDGAAALAKRWGLSPFIIGVVIVGFGTSAPELAVSLCSSASGHASLSLGNAYGSNICNIALVLGIMALVRPIRIKRTIRSFAVPVLAAAGFVTWLTLLYLDGIPRWMGAAMLLLFVNLVRWMMGDNKNATHSVPILKPVRHPWWAVTASLALLIVASHFVVWGSVVSARRLGVSELVIGLSVVAIGTSLPEFATSLAALRRHQTDIVLGNIVGSNLFNALSVVGLSCLIRPVETIPLGVLFRDLPLMTVLTITLCTRRISRCRAMLWLLVYLAYALSLVLHPLT